MHYSTYSILMSLPIRPIDATVINVCNMLQGWLDRWYRRRFLPIIYQKCSTSGARSGPIWDCPVKVNNVLISEPFVRHCAACFLSPWADWCENWFHLRPELIINRDNYLASTLQDSSLILSKSSSFHLLAFLLLITNPAKNEEFYSSCPGLRKTCPGSSCFAQAQRRCLLWCFVRCCPTLQLPSDLGSIQLRNP